MERYETLKDPFMTAQRWTLRGNGLQLWPTVVEGSGFEDEERIEVVRADALRGAVSVEDVERILVETSRYFSGDHVHAGVVVREVRKRLRVLAGGR